MPYTSDQLDQIVMLFKAAYGDRNCFYCGCTLLAKNVARKQNQMGHQRTRDHVVPIWFFGGGDVSAGMLNLVACCLRCNQRKGPLTLEEFRISLGVQEFFFEQDLRQRFHAGTLPWNGATFRLTGILQKEAE